MAPLVTTTTTTVPTETTTTEPVATTTTLPPTTTTIPPEPLVIKTESIPGGTTGGTYLVFLSSTGGKAPVSWSVVSGELPIGLELTSSGFMRGTPTNPGSYSFEIRVDDSMGDNDTESFSIDFFDPLQIETNLLASSTVGSPVSEDLIASGGVAPYKWELVNGLLPAGIFLEEVGRISGASQGVSESNFLVGVTDSVGNKIERQFNLSIVDPIVISNADLPIGSTGTVYIHEMNASGGTPPYEWEISGGVLPDGLEMLKNGEIKGIPEVAKISLVTVRATDSTGRSTSFSYELRVSIGLDGKQTVAARGGTANIEIDTNGFKLVDSYSNNRFDMYIVLSSPEKIQIHFIGKDGQIPSWILCELDSDEKCTFD